VKEESWGKGDRKGGITSEVKTGKTTETYWLFGSMYPDNPCLEARQNRQREAAFGSGFASLAWLSCTWALETTTGVPHPARSAIQGNEKERHQLTPSWIRLVHPVPCRHCFDMKRILESGVNQIVLQLGEGTAVSGKP